MVFLIDLPRQEDNAAAASRTSETRFSKDLSRFLSAAGVDEKMVNSLRNYDFSATADIGFVCSMYVKFAPSRGERLAAHAPVNWLTLHYAVSLFH